MIINWRSLKMSLELSHSDPKITAKTNSSNNTVNLYNSGPESPLINISIPMGDFCFLVEYILENTNLYKDDPRLKLVEKIKNYKIVPGYYLQHCVGDKGSRISIEEVPDFPPKKAINRFEILKTT
jgi:hypothetical protein